MPEDENAKTPRPFAKGMLSWWLGSGQVISGLDEGVRGMRTKGQRKCKIPSSRAYGSEGDGPTGKIPPFATLLFDVELVRVCPPILPLSTQNHCEYLPLTGWNKG